MSGDPVFDVSTEQQAIGRVFRPGQPRPEVNVFRLEMRGPNDERIMDGHLIDRNFRLYAKKIYSRKQADLRQLVLKLKFPKPYWELLQKAFHKLC